MRRCARQAGFDYGVAEGVGLRRSFLAPPRIAGSPPKEAGSAGRVAEGVGFEPTMGYEPIAVFKTAALGHYASPPVSAEV